MKNHMIKGIILLFAVTSLSLISAVNHQKSEKESDKSAGINGGFEITKNNLPVNWMMYTPNTVSNSDFKIELDKHAFKEGLQSLKFDVKKCSSIGGHASPGFTNEFFDSGKFDGEANYKVSFWYKNNGSRFIVKAGGVSAFEGKMEILIESEEQVESWKLEEYEIFIPKDKHLRIELNVIKPGIFWIDDVRIKKI